MCKFGHWTLEGIELLMAIWMALRKEESLTMDSATEIPKSALPCGYEYQQRIVEKRRHPRSSW
jgi:methyl coenzyme M reductase subunit D